MNTSAGSSILRRPTNNSKLINSSKNDGKVKRVTFVDEIKTTESEDVCVDKKERGKGNVVKKLCMRRKSDDAKRRTQP